MTNIKLISIFILTISLFFLGCVEEKPIGTPVPIATPTVTAIASPTVVPTTPTPASVPTKIKEQNLYISDVDDLYGFYKVTASNGSAPYDINNRTLTINAGDTVRWRSVTPYYVLTIVSQEGLWNINNSSSRLRHELSSFDYTFDKLGEYEIYIKEFPRETHQKIVVNP